MATNARGEAGEAPPPPPAAATEAWPREVPPFRWWEYVATPVLLGGSLALRFGVDVSGEPTWRGGILWDEAVYDAVFLDGAHQFRSWRTVGDVGYVGSFAWSVLDPFIAGVVYDWNTALQMTLMNAEALAVYSTVISLAQIAVRRERPSTRECDDANLAADLAISCASDNPNVNRSFIGGHVGTAAAAATLTCIHHSQLPLWGGHGADALPCVTLWAVTATVFTSRTLTGQHYFSDNLFGVGVGVLSGLVPYALHYGMRVEPSAAAEAEPLVQPTGIVAAPREGGLSLGLSGAFR